MRIKKNNIGRERYYIGVEAKKNKEIFTDCVHKLDFILSEIFKRRVLLSL